jgi:hypothetical protein
MTLRAGAVERARSGSGLLFDPSMLDRYVRAKATE